MSDDRHDLDVQAVRDTGWSDPETPPMGAQYTLGDLVWTFLAGLAIGYTLGFGDGGGR